MPLPVSLSVLVYCIGWQRVAMEARLLDSLGKVWSRVAKGLPCFYAGGVEVGEFEPRRSDHFRFGIT